MMMMIASHQNGASSSSSSLALFLYLLTHFLAICTTLTRAQQQNATRVPAMYVFGDSLMDVGNNNYIINSILKANFPHNGIDFPNRKPTGRFCNGKNAADFLAQKLGLPTSPPYLQNVNQLFLQGVSFASGGAGIFNTTNDGNLRRAIPLSKQTELFATVVHPRLEKQLSAEGAKQHLSKSIFAIVIGSNDFFNYFDSASKTRNTTSPHQYVDQMLSIFQLLFKELHRLGARKFLIVGVGAIGCCPSQRLQTETGECKEDTNVWADKYNQQLKTTLEQLKSALGDIHYTYFDTYAALSKLINQPSNYGFTEVEAACCGLGRLRAKFPCTPISQYCANRKQHLFWDLFHPSESAVQILVDFIYNGSEFVTPMNLEQLLTAV